MLTSQLTKIIEDLTTGNVAPAAIAERLKPILNACHKGSIIELEEVTHSQLRGGVFRQFQPYLADMDEVVGYRVPGAVLRVTSRILEKAKAFAANDSELRELVKQAELLKDSDTPNTLATNPDGLAKAYKAIQKHMEEKRYADDEVVSTHRYPAARLLLQANGPYEAVDFELSQDGKEVINATATYVSGNAEQVVVNLDSDLSAALYNLYFKTNEEE